MLLNRVELGENRVIYYRLRNIGLATAGSAGPVSAPLSYGCVVYTIAKRSTKRLKFLNPDPFTKRESAVSNFLTNLYGAIKSHNITAQSAPDFGHALFNSPEPLT